MGAGPKAQAVANLMERVLIEEMFELGLDSDKHYTIYGENKSLHEHLIKHDLIEKK